MTTSQADESLDAPILETIESSAPIQFDPLLRVMEVKVGHNRVSDAYLRRRLKVLRIAGAIQYSRTGTRGWFPSAQLG